MFVVDRFHVVHTAVANFDVILVEKAVVFVLFWEYPWTFTVLQTERKRARRFAKVSEEEIVAINEAAFFIHLIW